LNYLVGLSHTYVKQYAQAPFFLEQAIKYGSRATDINLWLGIGYQQQGLVDKAIEFYDKAAKDLPMDFRPYGLAGVMLAGEGRCDEAKTYLLNVFGRGGQTPDIIEAMKKCGLQ
jgi:tetratricopeptide (TPR) repeat protein